MQCDKCELWFHLLCIGLGEDEVSENEDYICFQCRGGGHSSSLGPIVEKKVAEYQSLELQVAASTTVTAPPPIKQQSIVLDPPSPPQFEQVPAAAMNSIKVIDVSDTIMIEETPSVVTAVSDGGTLDMPGLPPTGSVVVQALPPALNAEVIELSDEADDGNVLSVEEVDDQAPREVLPKAPVPWEAPQKHESIPVEDAQELTSQVPVSIQDSGDSTSEL